MWQRAFSAPACDQCLLFCFKLGSACVQSILRTRWRRHRQASQDQPEGKVAGCRARISLMSMVNGARNGCHGRRVWGIRGQGLFTTYSWPVLGGGSGHAICGRARARVGKPCRGSHSSRAKQSTLSWPARQCYKVPWNAVGGHCQLASNSANKDGGCHRRCCCLWNLVRKRRGRGKPARQRARRQKRPPVEGAVGAIGRSEADHTRKTAYTCLRGALRGTRQRASWLCMATSWMGDRTHALFERKKRELSGANILDGPFDGGGLSYVADRSKACHLRCPKCAAALLSDDCFLQRACARHLLTAIRLDRRARCHDNGGPALGRLSCPQLAVSPGHARPATYWH